MKIRVLDTGSTYARYTNFFEEFGMQQYANNWFSGMEPFIGRIHNVLEKVVTEQGEIWVIEDIETKQRYLFGGTDTGSCKIIDELNILLGGLI